MVRFSYLPVNLKIKTDEQNTLEKVIDQSRMSLMNDERSDRL